MLAGPPSTSADDLYSVREIARAANVTVGQARQLANREGVVRRHRLIRRDDAVRLVKRLTGQPTRADERSPINILARSRQQRGLPLAISGALHALLLALLITGSLEFLKANDLDTRILTPSTPRLLYVVTLGPGGGGGGGGLQFPTPPPRAQRAAPATPHMSRPVPPPVRRPPPPRPRPVIERPTPMPRPVQAPIPPPVDPPRPAAVPPTPVAPVASAASDLIDKAGVPAESAAQAPSQGSGTGGGIGSGTGAGLGEGRGPGIGEGSGGGTGGGPYRPGNGIEPPSLVREIKADYTDDARRHAIEGTVRLQIVVRRDGTVSDIHVLEGLGGGLERKAVDAVRQWKFAPAKRQGAPVDVVVDVSVDFKLR